jgi:hypothetical protein
MLAVVVSGENHAMPKFPPDVFEAIRKEKYLWIRAGDGHRFVPIWSAIVGSRLFIRSWYLRAGGWAEAFQREKRGAIRYKKSGPVIPVRARRVRSESTLAAVDRAYAERYTTPANRKYVKGFRLPKRRMTTTELVFDGENK